MSPFDCELLRPGWPVQPVNTISALAFGVVGVVLWRRGFRLPGIASFLVGVGSVLFHGAPGTLASWLHDASLFVLVAVAVVHAWRLAAAGRPPLRAAATFGVGLVVWALSRTGGPWCDPGSLLQGHALWHVLAAVAVGLLYRDPPRSWLVQARRRTRPDMRDLG